MCQSVTVLNTLLAYLILITALLNSHHLFLASEEVLAHHIHSQGVTHLVQGKAL
jgi:hypothetical protein